MERTTIMRIGKWTAIALASLLLLAGALVLGLNSDAGKRYVIEKISGISPANGLKINIARINGSLYGKMDLINLSISDPKGVFFTSPKVSLDWRPLKYLGNLIDVRDLSADKATLMRAPALIAGDPNAPLLPDLNFDIGRVRFGHLLIEPALTGRRHVAVIDGSLKIADRRAEVNALIATISRADIIGGDRMTLKLSAVPEKNILNLSSQVQAPADGLLAGLAGWRVPFDMAISGQGDWREWRGTLNAKADRAPLATLGLTARSGLFALTGTATPAAIVPASYRDLLSPPLTIAATAKLDQRRADIVANLKSAVLLVAAKGLVDLGTNRFDGVKADAVLLRQTAIASNMAATGLRASIALDGPMATPLIGYDVTAQSLGVNGIGIDGFHATGKAQIDSDHMLIPVNATARRISGLNATAGALLTNVRVAGDLAVQGPRILSDNLKIRSDRLDATALVVADMSRGFYTGAINGRLNDYRIESVGVFNLVSDVKLVQKADSGFLLRGKVSTRSTKLFSDGVRGFLGGNLLASSQLAYGSDGVVRFSNLRLTSPQLRVDNGAGRYTPNGGIDLAASGYSRQYGPLALKLGGTVSAPVAFVKAARPGAGIELVNLNAAIRGDARGYAITADGSTRYGPFEADAVIRTGTQRLTVDLKRALFAGVNFVGTIAQTAAGPFAGQLRGSGSGINGTVNLSSLGKYQRADIQANAVNASVPGSVPISIGRAIVNGSVILYDTPQINGQAQIASLRSGTLSVSAARAEIAYQGGTGTLKLLAEGSNSVPFRIAANAALSPKLYRVALTGRANGIDFKTASPAEIRPQGAVYRLAPVQINLSKGAVRLAGTYGNGYTLQSQLEKFDISLLNGVSPNLGLAGQASGRFDFAQGASGGFPSASGNLVINNFSRARLTGVSEAVDLSLGGTLQARGSDLRAVIRKGGTVVGRVQAGIGAVSGGGSLADALSAAALSGGIRYNGPAGVLFSFAALPDQFVSGSVGVAADFSGRVGQPRLVGIVRAKSLTYLNETYGTRLTSLAIDGRFTNDSLVLSNLTAAAGSGTVAAQGTIGLSATSGFPINLAVKLDNARLARSDALGATATGTLAVLNGPSTGAVIRGTLVLPETRYKIIRQGAAEVPELEGVRRKPALGRPRVTGDAAPQADVPGIWKLDLAVKADRRVFVSGMGLESEWQTDLRVRGTTGAPIVTGRADIIRGTYSFSGKRFEVDSGTVRFDGGPLTDPQLAISASTTVDGLSAILGVTGSGQRPRITFTSTPALPQDEVVSRLLFGRSVTSLSTFQVVQLAAALNSLRGSGGGLDPLGKLRSASGIDRLRILGADKTAGRGTALAAGKYITNDIYVEVITDARGFTATQLEIALSKSLSILSQSASFGTSNISVRFSKDY